MKATWKRMLCAAVLTMGITSTGILTVEAHGLWEALGKSVLGGISVHQHLSDLDNTEKGQQEMLEKQKTVQASMIITPIKCERSVLWMSFQNHLM